MLRRNQVLFTCYDLGGNSTRLVAGGSVLIAEFDDKLETKIARGRTTHERTQHIYPTPYTAFIITTRRGNCDNTHLLSAIPASGTPPLASDALRGQLAVLDHFLGDQRVVGGVGARDLFDQQQDLLARAALEFLVLEDDVRARSNESLGLERAHGRASAILRAARRLVGIMLRHGSWLIAETCVFLGDLKSEALTSHPPTPMEKLRVSAERRVSRRVRVGEGPLR
ncbi:hypothetical protein ON010_g12673 [Phytophthora cinnamomi]|nr:hypothetical protein ON010_g12673 [Phytophthora cinnamomi]